MGHVLEDSSEDPRGVVLQLLMSETSSTHRLYFHSLSPPVPVLGMVNVTCQFDSVMVGSTIWLNLFWAVRMFPEDMNI